jgi:hypothetical protein
VLGITTTKVALGVAAKRYCNHREELQLLYYSCVAVLVHESSKFLKELCNNSVIMAYGERFVP